MVIPGIGDNLSQPINLEYLSLAQLNISLLLPTFPLLVSSVDRDLHALIGTAEGCPRTVGTGFRFGWKASTLT